MNRTFRHLAILLLVQPLICLSAERVADVEVEAAQKAGLSDYNPQKFHALIVAIDKYEHWPDLRCAGNDGKTIANVLKTQYAFGNVKLLEDEKATRETILEALDGYMSLGENDSLLIYYAGHGWMDPEAKTGYWIPSEARRDKKFDYVANSRIVEDYFKKYKVKHLLVMADSCFSGTLLRGMGESRKQDWKLPAGFNKPSRWVMTSGDLAPVADDSGGGHSPFAARVLQYLKHSDSPAFGVQDLYVYVRKNLEGESIAQPMKTPAHMPGGEFVFCRLAKPLKLEGTRGLGVVAKQAGYIVHADDIERSYLKESARLFRSAQYESVKGRFEEKGSNTIFDKHLNKTWRVVDLTEIYSRKKAIEICGSLDGNYRLPTVEELRSLITQRKKKGDWGLVNGSFFPKHSRTSKFWTSSRDSMGGYFFVDFARGVPETGSEVEHIGVIAISD